MQAYAQEIVIDLEFNPTGSAVRNQGLNSEVIEIGAVRLNAAGEKIDTFQSFIRPEHAAEITSTITKLTGIRTDDVQDAPAFSEVLRHFCAWIGNADTRIVAWSDNDRRQILRECEFKNIEIPVQLDNWLDLQVVYPRLMGISNGKSMALSAAADWNGETMEDELAHRALYDASIAAGMMQQLLSGAHLQQKSIMEAAMPSYGQKKNRLATSIGNACSELEGLYRTLLAQENVNPAVATA